MHEGSAPKCNIFNYFFIDLLEINIQMIFICIIHKKLVAKPATTSESVVGFELGIIKSDVLREIAVLKSAFPDFDQEGHCHKSSTATTSPNCGVGQRQTSSNLVQPQSKWSEQKTRSVKRNSTFEQEMNPSAGQTNGSHEENDSIENVSSWTS